MINFMVVVDSKIDPLPNKALFIGGMIFGAATTIFDPLDGVCLSKSRFMSYLSMLFRGRRTLTRKCTGLIR